MVVKLTSGCQKACFENHYSEVLWCDTVVRKSTSGGLARGWRRAVGKKSPGICRSDVRQRASGSGSAALQSRTLSLRFWITCGCYSGNSPGQVRTGALAGDLSCKTLPAAKPERKLLRFRAALPLPLALCLTSLRQIPGDFLPTASPPPRPHPASPGPGHAVPENTGSNFVPENNRSDNFVV